jgi:hypothetical protein
VSREEVATAIREAEDAIASVLNFYPAPKFIEGEEVAYHQYHDRRIRWNNRTPQGYAKPVVTRFGRISALGRRAVALAEAGANILYSDVDGDSFDEIGTVTVDLTGSDALDVISDPLYTGSPLCDLKAYFRVDPSSGLATEGDPTFEIRHTVSRQFDPATNILTLRFYVWNLVDPVLWEAFPVNGAHSPINLDDANNFITEVDVYLEYIDWAQPYSEFHWRNEGCTDGVPCPGVSQDGCAYIVSSEAGIVAPYPGLYSEGIWAVSEPLSNANPDRVKLWYVSGDRRNTRTRCNDIDNRYKMAIFYLSVSLLVKDVCSCDNVSDLAADLREPLTVGSKAGNFIIPIEDVMKNPFGVSKGAVMAWRMIKQIYSESRIIGAIV